MDNNSKLSSNFSFLSCFSVVKIGLNQLLQVTERRNLFQSGRVLKLKCTGKLGLLYVISNFSSRAMEETIDRRASGTVDLSGNLCSAMDLTGRVHQLPCCIKYNGSSEVSNYFRPKPTEVVFDGLSVEEAQFRGRKLQGTTLPIPQGYSGFVLGKKKPDGKGSMSQERPNCWEVKAKFQNLTYWNHDTVPSQNDALPRTFHMFDIAKALHRPLSTEELDSVSIEKLIDE